MTIRNLDAMFNPRSVAVVGGSDRPGKLGTLVLDTLQHGGFAGPIIAVNPRPVDRPGIAWSPTIDLMIDAADLAIVVTPATSVPAVIKALGHRGTRAAVVLSAGLQDPALRTAMLDAARPHLLRILGPNCLGLMRPWLHLNASFGPRAPAPGNLAFFSQSGALVTAMLDWAADKHVGFTSVVSLGDMVDVDLGDLIDMAAADPETRAILLYVEAVTSAAKFMTAARAATRLKPVIAIKAGRNESASAAAFSHTGAMTGARNVYSAAFRRAGIIEVASLTELFDAAQVLSLYPPHCGPRLAIVTNGGGAGVLAADAASASGAVLPELHAATINLLDAQLPRGWSRRNPVDVVGDADPDRFAAAIAALHDVPDVDAMLVIHCPTAVASGIEIARRVIAARGGEGARAKPLIACWLGTANAASVRSLFRDAAVPLFDNIDDAVRGFSHLVAATHGLARVMRAPSNGVAHPPPDRDHARSIIDAARAAGRQVLTAAEARGLLRAYRIPVVTARTAADADQVTAACAGLVPPLAVKLDSPDLPHKTEAGAVVLNVPSAAVAGNVARAMAERVRREHPEAHIAGFVIEPMIHLSHGRELLVGIADDPTFGPVVAFGAGGTAVEILNDRAIELPPLDDILAGAMIDSTRVARLLAPYRNIPGIDRDSLIRILNAAAAMAADLPDLQELDINPLLINATDAVAIDARVRLTDRPGMSRLVIQPYPAGWERDVVTKGGVPLRIRPVRPLDEPALSGLFAQLSPDDLRFRFLTGLRHVDPGRIAAMTQIDYARTMHFIALTQDGTLVGSLILVSDPDRMRAEMAVVVAPAMRRRGVGRALIDHMLRYAAAAGIGRIEALESSENAAALALERAMGFTTHPAEGSATEMVAERAVAMQG